MSKSFYGMRQRKDVMHLKALHGSFNLLSETIGAAIDEVLSHASLITAQHQAINALVDKQHHLASMNAVLDNLGRELSRMAEQDSTRTLSEIAVEWLDAILLTLKDLAQEYNDADFALLQNMTSEDGRGLASIRESYLSAERDPESDSKILLVSATNNMDRLRVLFGRLADNYRKLAEATPG